MQTRNDRIKKHFRALKARSDWGNGATMNDVIMNLAQHWEIPCAEVREIVGWPGKNSPGYIDPETGEKNLVCENFGWKYAKWDHSGATLGVDPYNAEVRNDLTEMALCKRCRHKSAMDI